MEEFIDEAAVQLYRELDVSNGDQLIRVLDLHPGPWCQQLYGTLRVVSLASKPAYEALSYAWGNQSCKRITLNTCCEIPITDNLYDALRRLRKRRDKRTLWADAVCINQGDMHERSAQVAFMGSIYREASRVDVWIGEPRWHWTDIKLWHPFLWPVISPIHLPSLLRSLLRLNTDDLSLRWKRFRNHSNAADRAAILSDPPWHRRVWII
jgi:hypothetical protein